MDMLLKNSINYPAPLYFILVVLCWTLNPFIKKTVLKNDRITTDEYFIINHFVITLLFIGYFINVYLASGIDSVLFASGIAILASGIGILNKK